MKNEISLGKCLLIVVLVAIFYIGLATIFVYLAFNRPGFSSARNEYAVELADRILSFPLSDTNLGFAHISSLAVLIVNGLSWGVMTVIIYLVVKRLSSRENG